MANSLAWISTGSGLLVSEDFETGMSPAPNWAGSTSGSGAIDWNDTTSPSPLQAAHSLRLTNNGGNAIATIAFWVLSGTQTEVWGGLKLNENLAAGDDEFCIRFQDISASNLMMARIGQGGGAPRCYCGGSTFNSTAAGLLDATTYYCWFHYANTGIADFEFQTTNVRQGSGNNFASTTDATITANAAILFLGLSGVGSPSFMVFDEVRVSNTGYPTLT